MQESDKHVIQTKFSQLPPSPKPVKSSKYLSPQENLTSELSMRKVESEGTDILLPLLILGLLRTTFKRWGTRVKTNPIPSSATCYAILDYQFLFQETVIYEI